MIRGLQDRREMPIMAQATAATPYHDPSSVTTEAGRASTAFHGIPDHREVPFAANIERSYVDASAEYTKQDKESTAIRGIPDPRVAPVTAGAAAPYRDATEILTEDERKSTAIRGIPDHRGHILCGCGTPA